MRSAICRLLVAGLLAFLCLCYAPARAEARGLLLITYGDSIMHVQDVPADQREALQEATGSQNVQIGYAYSYFGLFWLDLWTWGGKWCLYKDKTYWKMTPAQVAEILHTSEDKLSKPTLYRFPLGLSILVVIIVGFVLLGILVKTDEEKAKKLHQDPRYGKAMEVFDQHMDEAAAAPAPAPDEAEAGAEAAPAPDPFPAAFAAAVQHLVSQGVAQKDAEVNLTLLLKVRHEQEAAMAQARAEARDLQRNMTAVTDAAAPAASAAPAPAAGGPAPEGAIAKSDPDPGPHQGGA